MNILVVAPNWIGDAVAAQPLFMRLKRAHPEGQITALAPPWVAGVLSAMPEIERVIELPFGHGEFNPLASWRVACRLRRKAFDAAYVLPNSFKSALIPWLAGIPRRIGFVGEMRYGLLNERHVLDKEALPRQVDRYAQLAEAPGDLLAQPLPNPRLRLDDAQTHSALAVLRLSATPAPVVLCPGAEFGSAKRWPERHFAALVKLLVAQGIPVWLLGSRKDQPVADEIARLAGPEVRNLCGSTNLAQAIALIAVARAVVTNDSGLMHVAAALSRPTVALFGSSSPEYTPPLSSKAQVVWLKLACSPCFQRECPLGHRECLYNITPESVMERLKPTLSS